MSVITEDNLQFIFDESVKVIKYDDSQWKNMHFANYPALDILVRHEKQQWWIEIKDCEGAEIDNRPRLSPADPESVTRVREWVKGENINREVRVSRKKPFIIDELVEKVRSTLVGCTIAQLKADNEVGHYQPDSDDKPLFVVLYLTWESTEFRRLARSLQTKLDKALVHYGWRGLVVNDEETLKKSGINCTISRVQP